MKVVDQAAAALDQALLLYLNRQLLAAGVITRDTYEAAKYRIESR